MQPIIYTIQAGDYEAGGRASRALKEHLKKLGADGKAVRRAMIAAYEAEMNVVIHSVGGEMKIELDGSELNVEVKDSGPGIADIDQAMREGYSTAPAKAREYGFGAGMGLPNIRRNSDRFSIRSTVGEGTTLEFKVLLKEPDLADAPPHSIRINSAMCRQCKSCLRVCPTRAIRVRKHKPLILDHLCIDCNICIGECPSGALSMESPKESKSHAGQTLVVSAAFLSQFGTGFPPAAVLQALLALGFEATHVLESWSLGIQQAAVKYARRYPELQPVIVPTCSAVLNLIQLRFPSLIPHVAPFLTPHLAARAMLEKQRSVQMVFCPSQCSQFGERAVRNEQTMVPSQLRNEVLTWLNAHRDNQDTLSDETPPTRPEEILRVWGLSHVMGVLNEIEDGLLSDVPVVELLACDQGCFGSPLLSEDCHVAVNRWESRGFPIPVYPATEQTVPLSARAGIRLDENMLRAMTKLRQMDDIRRMLPGRDCGVCGAPTCEDMAEDIVMNRAELSQCIYLAQEGDKEK